LVTLLIIRLSAPLVDIMTVILILTYLLNDLLMVLMNSAVRAVSFQTNLLPTWVWIELLLLLRLLLLFCWINRELLFKNPVLLG